MADHISPKYKYEVNGTLFIKAASHGRRYYNEDNAIFFRE